MKNILLADDHPVVRRGLAEILADAFTKIHIGEAATAAEVMELVQKQKWDLLVLDLDLRGRSGLDVLSDLKKAHSKIPVLVLSMHPEDQFAVRVLKAGASGYLTKEGASDELIHAINKILGGGKYVSASLAEKLASDLGSDSEKPPHASLSDREYQVLCLIASGKTATEISEHLSLSVKTISTYRARILEKMKMKTNAELTHYAIRLKLV